MSCVFVCRDHMLDPALDDLANTLAKRGIAIVRGPPSLPGSLIQYAASDYPAYFDKADVAIFTSRSSVPRELIEYAARLRGIVNLAVGVETIDLAAADEAGVIIGHGAVPENTISMAEATVMLMLNLRYQLRTSEEILQGRRPRPPARADRMHARMLRGCTVGLIGLGRIGSAVAERLLPFDVNLIAHAPSVAAGAFPPYIARRSLEAVLSQSDIVGLFASANDANRGLIDGRALSLMKPGAYLVNVARGQMVNEAALASALRDGRIAGAALDVFEVEPLPESSPLRALDTVILTPHLVGHTRELYESLGAAALENVLRILRDEMPIHCKNPQTEGRWRRRSAEIDRRKTASPGSQPK